MSKLEYRAISAYRTKMLRASIPILLIMIEEVTMERRGGNEQISDFNECLLRDAYAFGLCKLMHLHGYSVFGGFVISIYTGTEWNDIDFLASQQTKLTVVINGLKLMFGLHPRDVHVSHKCNKNYATTYVITIKRYGYKIDIPIDITRRGQNFPNAFIPCTVGSCLELDGTNVRKRITGDLLNVWNVEEIVEMLKEGNDMSLEYTEVEFRRFVLSRRKEYSEYYWSRIRKLRAFGLTVTFTTDFQPPDNLTSEA